MATGLFDEVMVVTDSEIIYNEITKWRLGKWWRQHESGSDRIAEAVADMEVDIVGWNVQGDEPFVQKEPLEKLLQFWRRWCRWHLDAGAERGKVPATQIVKVAVTKYDPLFFSADKSITAIRLCRRLLLWVYYVVYAFRKQALLNFTQ